MARVDDLLRQELLKLPPMPPESAKQSKKKEYSEGVSRAAALAFSSELRARGLEEALPQSTPGARSSGAERRMAGGIGAKKADVSWSTEESGLLLAISIKSINWRDPRTHNFQKNLVNRRGDALIEAVTLHRRFPYAVLACFFFLDKGAAEDETGKRRSTFLNAHTRLRLFSGRNDPTGRDEQYERMYLLLLDAGRSKPKVTAYAVGKPESEVPLDRAFDDVVTLCAERNSDFYEFVDGSLQKATR